MPSWPPNSTIFRPATTHVDRYRALGTRPLVATCAPRTHARTHASTGKGCSKGMLVQNEGLWRPLPAALSVVKKASNRKAADALAEWRDLLTRPSLLSWESRVHLECSSWAPSCVHPTYNRPTVGNRGGTWLQEAAGKLNAWKSLR